MDFHDLRKSASTMQGWLSPSEGELLYKLDGSHEYEFAKLDCELWLPKLIPGGWVAMHDDRPRPPPGGQGKYLEIQPISRCG